MGGCFRVCKDVAQGEEQTPLFRKPEDRDVADLFLFMVALWMGLRGGYAVEEGEFVVLL